MVRLFYIALVLLGFTISARWPMKAIAATDSPNVIVIFVDDQGYYDLGCYGATEVETRVFCLKIIMQLRQSAVRHEPVC